MISPKDAFRDAWDMTYFDMSGLSLSFEMCSTGNTDLRKPSDFTWNDIWNAHFHILRVLHRARQYKPTKLMKYI
jgi:hypothetical protein